MCLAGVVEQYLGHRPRAVKTQRPRRQPGVAARGNKLSLAGDQPVSHGAQRPGDRDAAHRNQQHTRAGRAVARRRRTFLMSGTCRSGALLCRPAWCAMYGSSLCCFRVHLHVYAPIVACAHASVQSLPDSWSSCWHACGRFAGCGKHRVELQHHPRLSVRGPGARATPVLVDPQAVHPEVRGTHTHMQQTCYMPGLWTSLLPSQLDSCRTDTEQAPCIPAGN